MREKLITCVSCQSEDELWCFDEQICALCRVDKKCLQAECVIPPMDILENEHHRVRQLIGWRDKILILPVQLSQRWIIYDKNTGNLEYGNFCRENHQSGVSVLKGNRIVLLPAYAKDPVVVIDLQDRKIIARYGIQNSYFVSDNEMEIWNATINQENIFFLIRGSYYYGKITDQEIGLIKIQSPEPLMCADFYEGGGWAVGSCGEYLYQFDENGNILKCVFLGLKMEISRILVKSQNIFLLPAEGNNIWTFDRSSMQIRAAAEEGGKNESIFPLLWGIPAFWDYVDMQDTVWFLPLQHPLQILDADTGQWQQKVITYTDNFCQKKYWSYCNYVRTARKQTLFFGESTDKELDKYLRLIQGDIYTKQKEKESGGKRIWKVLKEV